MNRYFLEESSQEPLSCQDVLKMARKLNIDQSIKVQHSTLLKRYYRSSEWLEIEKLYNIEVSGPFLYWKELQELTQDDKINGKIFSNNQYSYTMATQQQRLKTKITLQNGDKIPKFFGLKVNFKKTLEFVEHQKDQILVLIFWRLFNSSCIQAINSYQTSLKNKSNWNNKVRVVGIGQYQSIKSSLKNNPVWDQIQYLDIIQEDANALQILQVGSIKIITLHKDGRVAYISDLLDVQYESKIDKMLQQKEYTQINQSKEEKTEQLSKNLYTSDVWDQIVNTVQNLPKEQQQIEQYQIQTLARTSHYKDKQQVLINPIKLQYHTRSEKIQKYTDFTQKIISLFPKTVQFIIDPLIQNSKKYNLEFVAQKLSKILIKNGIKKPPLFINIYCLDILKEDKYNVNQQIRMPDLLYGQYTAQQVRGLLLDCKALKNTYTACEQLLFSIRDQNILKMQGTKFKTLKNLKEYQTLEQTQIKPKPGTVQIIFIKHVQVNDTLLDKLERIQKVIKKQGLSIQFHIIFLLFDIQVETIQRRHNFKTSIFSGQNIFFYLYKQQNSLSDLEVYYGKFNIIQTPIYDRHQVKIIVNPQNTIIQHEIYRQTEDQKFDLDRKWFLPYQTITQQKIDQDTVKILKQLPESNEISNLKEAFLNYDYKPSFIVTHTIEKIYPEREEVTSKLKMCITVRKEHKNLMDPIFQMLSKNAIIQEQIIETMVLPEGTECVQCQTELELPYYYYPWSKVHRCIDCSEEYDPYQQNSFKKFSVRQNAVLIFKPDTNVDIKRLGQNIQPQSQRQSKTHSYGCDGCGGYQGKYVRYICMGCRRQPNLGDYRDFCMNCAKNLQSKNKVVRDQVTQAIRQHEEDHALLRVLFNVKGYYKF